MKTNYSFLFLLALLISFSAFSQVPVITSFQGPSAVCGSPSTPKNFSTTATNNPTNYQWAVVPSTGVIVNSPNSGQSLISFPNVPGTYTIYVSASNSFGPSNTVTHVVTVFETPTVTFSGITSICQGSPTFLTASPTMISGSSTLSYSWSPGLGLSSTTTHTVMATPPVTTNYTLLLTTQTCSNDAQVLITVKQLPAIIPTSNKSDICVGETAILTINGNSDPYYVNSVYTPSVSTISPSVTTNYTITATGTNGCSNTVIFNQKVSACVGIQKATKVEGFSLYPNPSSGYFNLKSPVTETALIVNQLGQTVQKVYLEANVQTTVRDLPDGIYYLVTPSAQIKVVVSH